VLPLCCYRKGVDFMVKNTRFIKTLHYKSKLTHSENAQKMHCNANHRHCATHWKQETKKTGDSSNACVCLYRSLKLLTDNKVTSQRFNSKHTILSCCVIYDLTLLEPPGFGNFRKKNSSFQLPYQRPSSSADCARELFSGSNRSASLVDCTRKKIF